MSVLVWIAALASANGLVVAAPNNPPWKSWTFCKEVKPDESNECLSKAIESAVKNDLLKGNSYFGTPSMDPLEIPELSVFDEGINKPVAVNVTFRNAQVVGLSDFAIQSIKTDWDKGHIVGVVKCNSPVKFEADYEVGGKVILLPITGKGKSHITLHDMTVIMKGTFKVVEKKKKKYFKNEGPPLELKPKKITIHLENLFNGNKALGDQMNVFLNENWADIYKDMGPAISQAVTVSLDAIARRIYGKIPVDVMVPK